MRIGSLFSGYGGLDLGVMAALGGSVAWHAEIDADASRVLAEHWPDVPNLGDITGVDWTLVDPVDVLTGGFPCQDVSTAGRRAGLRPGTRSGLWSQMAYAVSVLRPRLVIAENVRGLLSAPAASQVEPCPWCLGDDTAHALRALGAVLGDLADLGYDTAWCGLRASDVGAPHARYRIFVAAADTHQPGRQGTESAQRRDMPAWGIAADADRVGPVRAGQPRRGRYGPTDHRSPVARLGEESADGHVRAAAHSPHRHEADHSPLGTAPGGPGRRVRGEPGTGVGAGTGLAPARVRELEPGSRGVDFGGYEPAIQRWEHILNRPAPAPTIDGKRGSRVLNPAFVEWMQGAPEDWVTGTPRLSRNALLRMLGNGVVPQQAAAAVPWLLDALDVRIDEVA